MNAKKTSAKGRKKGEKAPKKVSVRDLSGKGDAKGGGGILGGGGKGGGIGGMLGG